MNLRVFTPFILTALLLGACENTPKKPDPQRPQAEDSGASKGVKPRALDGSARLVLADKPISWRDDKALTGGRQRRLALLLAANKFSDPAFDIDFAGNNLKAMERSLLRHCGFQKAHIKTLSAAQLNRDSVEAAVQSLAAQATAKDNLLFIYFTGHGFIDAQGQPSFFTHFTRQRGSSWDKVFTRQDLALWIAKLRAQIGAGRGLRSLVVIDACRTRSLAPPPKAKLRPGQDWEIYGTGQGTLAAAPASKDPSPFTKAFVESLEAASSGTLSRDLKSLFAEARRRTLEYSARKQKPELFIGSASREPRLVVARRLRFAVEAVDALNGARIATLRLKVDSRPVTESAQGLAFVECSANPHLLSVAAPGYLSRSEQLELSEESGGRLLRIPLWPNIVLVEGRLEPPTAARVEATGDWRAVRAKYHRLVTDCDAEGRFELRLPALVKGASVTVKAAGLEPQRRLLPTQPTSFRHDRGQSHDDLGLVDLGLVALSKDPLRASSSFLKWSESKTARRDLPTVLRKPPSARLKWSSKLDQQDWNNVMRAIKAERWSLARQEFARLRPKMGRAAGDWWQWLEYQSSKPLNQDALLRKYKSLQSRGDSAKSLRQGLLILYFERAFQEGEGFAKACDPKLEPWTQELSKLAESAEARAVFESERVLKVVALAVKQGLLESKIEWALAVLRGMNRAPLKGQEAWDQFFFQSLPQLLQPLMVKSLAAAKATGDWRWADFCVQVVEYQAPRWPAGDKALDVLRELAAEIRREKIPLSTRRHFDKAQRLFADGQWPEAFESYKAAQFGANEQYLHVIRKQLTFLSERLAQRFLNEGFEHRLERDFKASALAYERAMKYHPPAFLRLQAVLREPKNGLSKAFIDSKTSLVLKARAAYKRTQDAERQRRQNLDRALADSRAWNRLSKNDQDALIRLVGKDLGSEYQWLRTETYSLSPRMQKVIIGPLSRDLSCRVGTFRHKKTGIELNLIPGGAFAMGAELGTPGVTMSRSNERPQHSVTVKPMLIARREVSQSQWARLMTRNPSIYKGEALPVHGVSWNLVKQWLALAGGGLRLPSEAEWEYSCRGMSTGDYFWGEPSLASRYCWSQANSRSQPHSVFDHDNKTNAFGLSDMSGNVSEWLEDRYFSNYSKGPKTEKPRVGSSEFVVYRGGSFQTPVLDCRSARRFMNIPGAGFDDIGFRVARTVGKVSVTSLYDRSVELGQ